jgi:hypothetical protein
MLKDQTYRGIQDGVIADENIKLWPYIVKKQRVLARGNKDI